MIISFLLFFCAVINATFSAPINVVVTIKPIHSLVASLMDKTENSPILLMDDTISPHHRFLKPSEVESLKKADLIIWVGPEYETGLITTMEKLGNSSQDRTIQLTKSAITLYPKRSDSCGCNHHHHHHHHTYASIDGHVWLDPLNAIKIASVISDRLMAIDPDNSEHYKNNLNALEKRLNDLHDQLTHSFKIVNDKCYMTYHDATQYFDKRYGFNMVQSITEEIGRPLSFKTIGQIEAMKESGDLPQKIFLEPQFSLDNVEKIFKNYKIKVQYIDYIGIHHGKGKDAYFKMMNDLKNTFVG